MWVILGFHEPSRQDHNNALETCKSLNKDGALYEVKKVKPNTVYDYEWNVMDEDDYHHS